MDFSFPFMFQAMAAAITAVPRSLAIAFSAVGAGILLGMPVALARFYRLPALSQVFAFLITISKALPTILLYFVFYVILGRNAGLSPNVIAASAIAVSCIARMAETFRGALESIEPTQFDAAYAVGHTGAAAFFRIILPQMIPAALPVMSGGIIMAVKAVPVAVLIGVMDILNTALSEAVINYRYLEAYFAAALVFWGIFVVIERTFIIIENYFQKKMRKSLI